MHFCLTPDCHAPICKIVIVKDDPENPLEIMDKQLTEKLLSEAASKSKKAQEMPLSRTSNENVTTGAMKKSRAFSETDHENINLDERLAAAILENEKLQALLDQSRSNEKATSKYVHFLRLF